MSFETALEEVANADTELREVVRILCGMATFAGLIGRNEERDRAVEVAAELLGGIRAGLIVDWFAAGDEVVRLQGREALAEDPSMTDEQLAEAVMVKTVEEWNKLGRPVFAPDAYLTSALVFTDPDAVEGTPRLGFLGDMALTLIEQPARSPLPVFVLRLPFPFHAATEVMVVSHSESGNVLPIPLDGMDETGEAMFDLTKLVASFLQWYSSLDQKPAALPSRKPSSRARERGEIAETIHPCTTIKVDRRLIEAAKHYGDPKYQLKARFIVRGHWRHQACGPGMRERRLAWIKPFWKGDPALEPIQHIYKAGGAK